MIDEGNKEPSKNKLWKVRKTMYALRNIQFNKQQKNVQFFNKKNTGLVLVPLLDGMCKGRFVWFNTDILMYAHRLSNKAGGYFYAFGKIAPMVERWVEAPCGTGSSPVLPAWQFV